MQLAVDAICTTVEECSPKIIPGNYSNYFNCNWLVHAQDGSPIIIDLNVDGIDCNDYSQVCLVYVIIVKKIYK